MSYNNTVAHIYADPYIAEIFLGTYKAESGTYHLLYKSRDFSAIYIYIHNIRIGIYIHKYVPAV